MDVMDAIYQRRSVRAYRDEAVDEEVVRGLLDAAIQAPSAMNAQPWAFAIVQDRARLRGLSDRAKAHLLRVQGGDPRMAHYRDELSDPSFDIFYGAPTLVVIYAGPQAAFPAEDCALAAENLMLAAVDRGLATCCIGWARPLLELADIKRELGVPAELVPILPIILGHPSESPPVPRRNPPRIVAWR